MGDQPSGLFVCGHDAGRSQMAAAYLSRLGEGRIEVLVAELDSAVDVGGSGSD